MPDTTTPFPLAQPGAVESFQVDPEVMGDKKALRAEVAKLKAIKMKEAARLKKERDALIAKTIKEEGDTALRNISPIVFSARVDGDADIDSPQVFLRPCVSVTPMVNPLLDAVLQKLGASKRGARTYAVQMTKKASLDRFRGILSAIPGEVCYDPNRMEKLAKKGGHYESYSAHYAIRNNISTTPLGNQLGYGLPELGSFYLPYGYVPLHNAAIQISVTGHELFIRIMTQKNPVTKGLYLYEGAPDLHLLRHEYTVDPLRVTPDTAIALLGAAEAHGYPAGKEDAKLAKLRTRLQDAVIAQAVPGSPGEARLIVGKNVSASKNMGEMSPLYPGCQIAKASKLGARSAGEILRKAEKKGSVKYTALHSSVRDVMEMEMAKKVSYKGLLPYQNDAVKLHLATNVGYLNACSPGLGKTIMTLVGCKLRAERSPEVRYRALVTAPKALTGQWAMECERFFPEATSFTIKTTNLKTLEKLLRAQAEQDDNPEITPTPYVFVGSYDAIKKAAPLLRQFRWNDLAIDEAAMLKNLSSARAKALWELRPYADVAIALTGTPIDKGLDDIGLILSWVRADESMFHARKLSARYDISDQEDIDALWQAVGPVVFRRDRSEIADQLPKIAPQVLLLDPHKTETDLAEGARKRLREIFLDMQTQIEKQMKKARSSADKEALEAAKQELRSARGAVLGGVTLARMAASDPASVEGSDSVGAALLDADGLIAPAVKHGGTKRAEVIKLVKEQVKDGEAVLIFTDFTSVAERLLEDLDEAGLRVGKFTGQQKNAERDGVKHAFQGTPCMQHKKEASAMADCPNCTQPELDVLVLTKAAKEGLNLQRANVLYHYDLSWVPSDFVQRIGRASRFGSRREQLKLIIPIMSGTIEERVASVLIPRAMAAMQALDSSRGIGLEHSDMAGAAQELALKIDTSQGDANTESIFDFAKTMVLNK